jgi:hypothetical protein
MYYRGAAAAIVVYDITNKVLRVTCNTRLATDDPAPGFTRATTGVFQWSKVVGQGAAAAR